MMVSGGLALSELLISHVRMPAASSRLLAPGVQYQRGRGGPAHCCRCCGLSNGFVPALSTVPFTSRAQRFRLGPLSCCRWHRIRPSGVRACLPRLYQAGRYRASRGSTPHAAGCASTFTSAAYETMKLPGSRRAIGSAVLVLVWLESAMVYLLCAARDRMLAVLGAVTPCNRRPPGLPLLRARVLMLASN